MKILNLYAGIGGNRKLWDETLEQQFGNNYQITAVEINPEVAAIYQDFYPNDKVIITDAHQYLLEHYKEFNFIWSSPPCQTHSAMARVNNKRYNLNQYPDMKLWQEIIYLNEFFRGKWIVENVKPYYKVLFEAQKRERHLFWANFIIPNIKKKKINNFIDANYANLQEWLDIKMTKKVYLNKNHDYCQILRNCVHPEIGKVILDTAMNCYKEAQTRQMKLDF